MQPESSSGSLMYRVARKEIALFFVSPVAYLFLASFAAITLFVFFWGETFFARNIADVRPMFEWMPLLLIFLCATLTMRLWSEERRLGTLEFVLTQAAPLYQFVLGKFLACLFLLTVALLITLPLPITVSYIGDLDWGPVVAGYTAALLMGAAYLSIGLFVSARSDNQIVSLISAMALGGIFYLLGTNIFTNFFGTQTSGWLRLLGSGSRFDSITRGVIDLRDLIYYFSITAAFLALNVYVLERERWARGGDISYHRNWRVVVALLVTNALALNLWLGQVGWMRMDLTEGRQYSISDATRNYLAQLREPLLVRGYFSDQTHPLLAPLVPRLQDLLREYEVAGNGALRVEIVDPQSDPALEEEANRKYGIQPVPFQVADRHQSSIVSSYFNVLLQYGDETQVLDFNDLIEIKAGAEGEIDVRLRNPEYDITRAIKHTLRNYQGGGNLFDTIKGDLIFTGYISGDHALPEALGQYRIDIENVLEDIEQQADGRLAIRYIDPGAPNSEMGAKLAQDYGFQPMATSLFDQTSFYFYMTLSRGDTVIQIPLEDVTVESFERNLKAGLKRFSAGFTRTVALVVPDDTHAENPYVPAASMLRFSQVESFLSGNLDIQREDLKDGAVSGDADLLVLLAPQGLTSSELWAVDQFLMQGGTVIAATSPFSASLGRGGINLAPLDSGLSDWLKHHGLEIKDSLVLDPLNTAFPIPVTRNIGGFQLQEVKMIDYPYFPDIRGEGLNQDNLITSNLQQLSMAWASPIVVTENQEGREIIQLITSSPESWLSSDLNAAPRLDQYGNSGFAPTGEKRSHLLGIISQGEFESFFNNKESPLVSAQVEGEEPEQVPEDEEPTQEKPLTVSSVIERSPESARIILVSSNDFLSDQVIGLIGAGQSTEYLSSLQFLANALDWSMEDSGLLSIRSRGQFNRTLPPLARDTQVFWEYLNYFLAAMAIGLIAMAERYLRARRRTMQLTQLT